MNFLTTILPVITLIIGSGLTYYISIKTKQFEAARIQKENQYAQLVILIQGFVGSTANATTKDKFYEELYKSWLYGSDEVIEAINDMTILLMKYNGKTPPSDIGKKAIGNIILAMRKDLRGKTKLAPEAFQYIDVS